MMILLLVDCEWWVFRFYLCFVVIIVQFPVLVFRVMD